MRSAAPLDCARSAPLARDTVWIPSGPAAAQQRLALSTGPAEVEEIIAVIRAVGDRPTG